VTIRTDVTNAFATASVLTEMFTTKRSTQSKGGRSRMTQLQDRLRYLLLS